MKCGKKMMAVITVIVASISLAYTPAETNDVIRGRLLRTMSFYNHDNFRNGQIIIRGDGGGIPDTWEGFLGKSQDGRWTTEERKDAFDWYLSTLGTIDCSELSRMDQKLVRTALGRCEVLCYTNSAPALRALALNPKGVHRDEAIELFLKFSPTGDATTTFVETIMTNVVGYSLLEQEMACGTYGYRLCLSTPTNAIDSAAKARAVEMFYRNRNAGVAAAHIVDMLLVSNVVNYATSSNRLETVKTMLSNTELDEMTRGEFIAITNQLLSSGQPLRWINVGGTSE